MIEYDQRRLPLSQLLAVIDEAERSMKPADDVQLAHRVLHLPMAFNDEWTREAIGRYMRSGRAEAPYLPSNVEFVAKNNGGWGRVGVGGAWQVRDTGRGDAAVHQCPLCLYLAGISSWLYLIAIPAIHPTALTLLSSLVRAGLEGDPVDAVRKVVFDASYMVMGLGDVYLGAPCAVPVDPRHRLVVPKYNPARTYTPEGAVGIGGTYMCIVSVE
jgi:allophanate hydrolase subunit 1